MADRHCALRLDLSNVLTGSAGQDLLSLDPSVRG
jgi:hypothetical protein